MDLLTDKITNFDWTGMLVKIGYITIKVILIYLGYLILNVIGKKVIQTSFERYQKKVNISSNRAKTLERLVENAFSYILLFIFFVTILQAFGIGVTGILAGAGIVGLAVGFGAQGLVSDIVTGFFLLLERQVDVDDYVTIGTFSGVVEQVGLRTIKLRAVDGTLHFLPNRQILNLSNHSRGNMQALVDITVGNSFSIDHAISSLQKACDQIAAEDENIVEGPNVLGVQSLGSSDVVLRIIAKAKNGKQSEVERKLRKIMKETLDHQLLEEENNS